MNEIDHIDALEHEGKLAEARDRVLELAERSGRDRPGQRARMLARASELALYVDGPERGEELAREARSAAEASGEAGALALAGTALARVHLRHHTDASLEDAEAALDGIGDLGELPDHLGAVALKLRGMVEARRGHPRDALKQFADAYSLAEGVPALRARVLITWAVQLRNWGLYAEAERRAERSLEIRLELGDHYGAALCYGVLAFIYQRQGLWQRERDALAADLRECERIGTAADIPGLHARLAGALVGLGKYAGAWSEAEQAIELESARLAQVKLDVASATRVHAYAWREQARVCLSQGRTGEGRELAKRAAAVFARLRDGYGEALAVLTQAELALEDARDEARRHDAGLRVATALAAARPVFVRLGAVPEAVETVLIEVELAALDGGDAAEAGGQRIVAQVLPMLQQAGLGGTALFRRALQLAERVAPSVARDRVVDQAAVLRSLAAIVVETEPQDATVVAVRAGEEDRSRGFGRAAVDRGAVVLWPDSDVGVAILLGERHEDRAVRLLADAAALSLPSASATGEIDLEHLWPAGVRARGAALEAALAALAEVASGRNRP